MNPKFRAWTEEGEVMYYDAYPFKDDTLLLSYDEIAFDEVPASDFVLMQSTGLFDKNGKEIFEGDIIRKKETTNETVGHGYQDLVTFTGEFVVHFEGGAFVTKGTRKKYYQSIDLEEIERVKCLLSQIGDGYEVVGNRYENPELVEAENE